MANKLRKNSSISEEAEALFSHDINAAASFYYVQSPSAFSHQQNNKNSLVEACGVVALSPYSSSSSRVSTTNSFLHEINNKASSDVQLVQIIRNTSSSNLVEGDEEEDEEEEEEEEEEEGEWWWWLTLSHSTTCGWKLVQITWRFLVSMVVAFLVFYVLTKPPPPLFSIQFAGIPEFELSEGVDESGVTTKVLTCNCTLHIVINNKSQLFALHIHSPTTQMAFAHLPFATSQGRDLQAGPNGLTKFKLFVDARNKPMYSAGRSMQELLDAKNGLPLGLHISIRSNFQVVWGLIKPKYHHQLDCLIILHSQEITQKYNCTPRYSLAN